MRFHSKHFLFLLFFLPVVSLAQYKSRLNQQQWVDSVFNSLSKEERIAQLMVIRAHSNLGADHIAKQQAIKTGVRLTEREMSGLVTDLFATEQPNTTADGNPTYLEFKQEQLERMFRTI